MLQQNPVVNIEELIAKIEHETVLSVNDLKSYAPEEDSAAYMRPKSQIVAESIRRIQTLYQSLRAAYTYDDRVGAGGEAYLDYNAQISGLYAQILYLKQEKAQLQIELQREREQREFLQEKLNRVLGSLSVYDMMSGALTASAIYSQPKQPLQPRIRCFLIVPPEGGAKRERRYACEAYFCDGECVLSNLTSYEQTVIPLSQIFKIMRNDEALQLRNKVIAARATGFDQPIKLLAEDGVFDNLTCSKQFVQGEHCFGVSYLDRLVLLEFDSDSDAQAFETYCLSK